MVVDIGITPKVGSKIQPVLCVFPFGKSSQHLDWAGLRMRLARWACGPWAKPKEYSTQRPSRPPPRPPPPMPPHLHATRLALLATTSDARTEMAHSLAAAGSPACAHAFTRILAQEAERESAAARPGQRLAGLAFSVKDLFDIA